MRKKHFRGCSTRDIFLFQDVFSPFLTLFGLRLLEVLWLLYSPTFCCAFGRSVSLSQWSALIPYACQQLHLHHGAFKIAAKEGSLWKSHKVRIVIGYLGRFWNRKRYLNEVNHQGFWSKSQGKIHLCSGPRRRVAAKSIPFAAWMFHECCNTFRCFNRCTLCCLVSACDRSSQPSW